MYIIQYCTVKCCIKSLFTCLFGLEAHWSLCTFYCVLGAREYTPLYLRTKSSHLHGSCMYQCLYVDRPFLRSLDHMNAWCNLKIIDGF